MSKKAAAWLSGTQGLARVVFGESAWDFAVHGAHMFQSMLTKESLAYGYAYECRAVV
jgi:hypothetical protein